MSNIILFPVGVVKKLNLYIISFFLLRSSRSAFLDWANVNTSPEHNEAVAGDLQFEIEKPIFHDSLCLVRGGVTRNAASLAAPNCTK